MLVAIDASPAVRRRPTGVEGYTRSIIEALALKPRGHRIRCYANATDRPSWLPAAIEWRGIPFPRLWTHWRFAQAIRRDRPDVVFVPGHVLPLFCAAPGVVTIHDLGHLSERGAYRALDWWYLELTTRWMAGHARRLIAVSGTTARDLERAYHVPPERIRVVRSGVDESMRPQPSEIVSQVRQRYGLPDTYFLYVGRTHPRKNLPFLLRAFEQARRQGLNAGLVLAGPGDAPAGEAVRRLVYVPHDELAGLYSGALALLLPSRFEGFGFPVLEAMACATAVVASNAGALPEIVGDAGIVLSPDDLAGWTQAITELARDGEARQRLVQRGLARSREFSWQAAADAVWPVLEEAAGYATPREPETASQ